MSNFEQILDVKRHELVMLGNKNKVPYGSLLIRDKISNELLMIPNTLETRQFFNISESNTYSDSFDTGSDSVVSPDTEANSIEGIITESNNNSKSCSTSPIVSNCTAVKWTDANAVKELISNWKKHESYFKNPNIRNNKVWQIIADNLKKTNPLWNFTGTQCENKFKDVRKAYTKVKDHNNQSGAEFQTCKFYEDMEAVLGEKPIVKPIAISSSLKKRIYPNLQRAISPCSSVVSDESCDEKENIPQNKSQTTKKKSKVARELEKWSAQQSAAAEEREQARMQRHREKMERQDKAIAAYKEQMEKLLEKL